MKDMKAMIIVNPSSGNEQAKKYVKQLQNHLAEHSVESVIKETQKSKDAEKFASQASLGKFDSVFLMGGDGTVNEGINGIAKQDYKPTVGVIPTGTINNFARALGISMNPEEAISQLDFTHKKKIDIGKVNDLYFISTVSVGAIPETVQEVDEESKSKFGPLAYIFEGVKALSDDETSTFQVTLDGTDFEDDFSMVLIGLSQSVAGIETVFSSAEIDDGYLNMLCLKESTASEKIKLIPELIRDDENYSDKLVLKRFKVADMKTKQHKGFTTTVDGDQGPDFPIHLEVMHKLVSVYVPSDDFKKKK